MENMHAMKTRLPHLENFATRSNYLVSGLASTSVKPAINEFINSVLKTNVNITEARKLSNKGGFMFTMKTALEVNAVVLSNYVTPMFISKRIQLQTSAQ